MERPWTSQRDLSYIGSTFILSIYHYIFPLENMSSDSSKRKSEESADISVSKKLFLDSKEIIVCPPSQSQAHNINISPSIARNPNKYLGVGSHKKNLQEAIESNAQDPQTPTKSPKKRLSKFSPFKKSPGKSPRKEMFPKQIDDQETDGFINTYDRTFEKVSIGSVVFSIYYLFIILTSLCLIMVNFSYRKLKEGVFYNLEVIKAFKINVTLIVVMSGTISIDKKG